MSDHPADFVTLDRTAEAWNTPPERVLAWLQLDSTDMEMLAPPARAEVGRRLADLRKVANSFHNHGLVPSWTLFLHTPIPETGGRTIAEHVAEDNTQVIIDAIKARVKSVSA
jgi:hypothetical protein